MSCDVGEVTERLENGLSSPTSQLILEPFFRFSYVTGSSPGEPPMTNRLLRKPKVYLSLLHKLFIGPYIEQGLSGPQHDNLSLLIPF